MSRAFDMAVRAAELAFAVGVVSALGIWTAFMQPQGYMED